MKRDAMVLAGFVLLLGFLILGISDVAFADDGITKSLLKTGSALAAILGIVGIAVPAILPARTMTAIPVGNHITIVPDNVRTASHSDRTVPTMV